LLDVSAGAAIPIGIAVGRQRLQEATNQAAQQLQSKELSRFGLGLAELGKLLVSSSVMGTQLKQMCEHFSCRREFRELFCAMPAGPLKHSIIIIIAMIGQHYSLWK